MGEPDFAQTALRERSATSLAVHAIQGETAASPPPVLTPLAVDHSGALTKQEAEIGLYIINEIVTTPGIDLAGPIPPELQFYIQYSAAILIGASQPEAANELVKFLSSATALPVIKAKGMEPG